MEDLPSSVPTFFKRDLSGSDAPRADASGPALGSGPIAFYGVEKALFNIRNDRSLVREASGKRHPVVAQAVIVRPGPAPLSGGKTRRI